MAKKSKKAKKKSKVANELWDVVYPAKAVHRVNTARVGVFCIPASELDTNLHRLSQVFSLMGFVPTEVVNSYHSKSITYTGYSHLFEEIEPHCVAHEYQLNIRGDSKVVANVTVYKI